MRSVWKQTLDLTVADDQPIFALGVERVVASRGIGCVTHRVSDSATLIAILHADACDVLVTNFMFEGDRQGGGLRTLGYVRCNFPALPIVVFTVAENCAIYRETWRLGVAALVSKADSPGVLLLAIRSAASGQRYRSAMIRRGSDRRRSDPATPIETIATRRRSTPVRRASSARPRAADRASCRWR
ncbi:response regulator [Burkholderia ubonensis]|uniref:response regulator n=1 Tax=Burkholderia ubonensis TaxID=101571 RepID=UPI0039F5A317